MSITARPAREPEVDPAVRAAISDARPARASALSASLTFGWRSMLKIKHVPEQLGDVIMIPVLFTVMFTYIFGGALAGSTGRYLQFLLPGTVVMSVVLVTVYTGVSLNTDLASGVSDRFRTLPIWQPAVLLGPLLGDTVRYLIASSLVIGLGLIMGFDAEGGAIGVLAGVALVLVFAFALGWVWSTLGLTLRTPNAVLTMGLVVLFPLTFASNVFVEPGTLPGWLRAFVDVNPVSHLASAERALMLGTGAGGDVLWVLAASAVLTAVFAPLTVHLYRRRT